MPDTHPFRDEPLVGGAFASAVGAVISPALPRTETRISRPGKQPAPAMKRSGLKHPCLSTKASLAGNAYQA
ncbi:hypothetical protein E0H54_25425 [Rhizobium leguminosarum bv. viciae]|nr:hypothetical protein E0H54_25425 [Rhizobium leguminosarum bv. viciae]